MQKSWENSHGTGCLLERHCQSCYKCGLYGAEHPKKYQYCFLAPEMSTTSAPYRELNCCGGHSSVERVQSESNWQKIIWNNKEIRKDKKPVYFKNYYESGIVNVNDPLFNLSSNDSFDYLAKKT